MKNKEQLHLNEVDIENEEKQIHQKHQKIGANVLQAQSRQGSESEVTNHSNLGGDSPRSVQKNMSVSQIRRGAATDMAWASKNQRHPYIFPKNQYSEKIRQGIIESYAEVYEALDARKVFEIEKQRALGNFLEADYAQMKYLMELYGLQSEPLLGYEKADSTITSGRYFYQYQFDDGTEECMLIISRYSDPETGNYDQRDLQLEAEMGGVITHELRHALQFQEIEHGTKMGRLYETNFDSYEVADEFTRDDPALYERYSTQLVEREAFASEDAYNDVAKSVRLTYMGRRYDEEDENYADFVAAIHEDFS